MDLQNVDNETLWKMFDEVSVKYYQAATKPCGDGKSFLKSQESKKLEKITKQYEDIGDEIRRRHGSVSGNDYEII